MCSHHTHTHTHRSASARARGILITCLRSAPCAWKRIAVTAVLDVGSQGSKGVQSGGGDTTLTEPIRAVKHAVENMEVVVTLSSKFRSDDCLPRPSGAQSCGLEVELRRKDVDVDLVHRPKNVGWWLGPFDCAGLHVFFSSRTSVSQILLLECV
jgi:hypothetical protein